MRFLFTVAWFGLGRCNVEEFRVESLLVGRDYESYYTK